MIEEEALKVRPLSSKKKTNQLNPRVRYHAIAMVGDGDGFYGYSEAIKKNDWAAERAVRSQATLRWRQTDLGYTPLKNPRTVPREARARNGGISVIIRPTPACVGINGPPMARRMLQLIGIRDCLLRVQRNTRMAVNLARVMNSALQRL